MADLVREHKIAVVQHTVRQLDKEGSYSVDAIVDDAQIADLEAREAYTIERHEDVDEVGRARLEEVGKEDDFEQARPD